MFSIHIMYLLTQWEGRTGKYLARGHDVRIHAGHRGVFNDMQEGYYRAFICELRKGKTTYLLRRRFELNCTHVRL